MQKLTEKNEPEHVLSSVSLSAKVGLSWWLLVDNQSEIIQK